MKEFVSGWAETLLYATLPWMVLLNELPWVGVIVQLAIGFIASVIIHRIATSILEPIAQPFPYSRRLVQYGHRAAWAAMFFLIAQIILRNAPDRLPGVSAVLHIGALCLIASLTWLGIRCVRAISHSIIELNPADSPDNLHARRIQTQTKVLARSVMGIILLIGIGAACSTLPVLRQIGTSLLASAGVAGLVVGFAAKPVLGNLLAGLQIALSQPIRLEDVVIVNNEWGHIEEITGSYVVVRIWDQRRMIVPLQWFIENPFQNWTRTSAEILGVVLVWADYRLPVAAVREEAERICRSAPQWDGRLCQTQVVDATDRAMQLRILVSAGDAGRSWELRCLVREGLIDFIQREFPEYLPRVRTEVVEDQHRDSTSAPPAPPVRHVSLGGR
ncbi:MAG TPA: mechanosensitive ion channel domain-containing protein [Noviherbaspirillum sp.]|jgi:small-conductance mechanosensitive channel|uniref:mechanosensitive ion channel family protein n=1 Tax=Noviherbaspirillum sp. TaxID=1926288 RepID=UPI002DDDB26D|nr:mechanosensitive ion channel domain-containing protein [Noviherbaspirillum sp.]HEV2611040.1 mechanosensitive ion channel domain-containing protein [Noviherbaspirillum sp.]